MRAVPLGPGVEVVALPERVNRFLLSMPREEPVCGIIQDAARGRSRSFTGQSNLPPSGRVIHGLRRVLISRSHELGHAPPAVGSQRDSSTIIAIPIPPPTQSAARPYLTDLLFIS